MIKKLREFIFCGRVENWENTPGYQWAVFFIFLLLLPVFFGRLGENTLLRSDELTHAEIAKEILHTGDWFTMHNGGGPTWLKPPLYFWIEASLFKIFGLSEYWSRFPAALAGYATLILVFSIGTRLYGKKTGLFSIVVLATSFLFLKYSRRAMLDVPVAFITTLGVYALLRGEEEKRYDLLFGLTIALGYYIKAVQGMYIAAIGPIYLIVSAQWKRLVRPSMIAAYGGAVAIIAAWVWPQILVNGDKFIYSQSGIFPIIHRGVLPEEHMAFYTPLVILLKRDWPWLPASVCGLGLLIRKNKRNRASELIFVWTGAVLFALMVSNAVYERYVIPVMPALSLCGGVALSRWLEDNQLCSFSRISTAFISLAVLVGTCLPIPLDRRGYAQNDFIKTINYFIPKNEPILLYKKYVWGAEDSLSFYAGRYIDKRLNSIEELTKERRERKGKLYCIARNEYFTDIEHSAMKNHIHIVISTNQFVLFELLPANGAEDSSGISKTGASTPTAQSSTIGKALK